MKLRTVESAAQTWARIKKTGLDAFRQHSTSPFLLGLFLPKESENLKFATLEKDTDPPLTMEALDLPRPVPESLVIPVEKREGISFADKITVGRTQNNDIVINDLLVSKLHGFFSVEKDGRVAFTDGGSSNGTKINGRRIMPAKPTVLRSKDTIVFGTRAAFLFLDARDLIDRLETIHMELGNRQDAGS